MMPFLAVQIHKKVFQYISHFHIPDLQNKRTLMPGKCISLPRKPGAAVQYMKFIVYIIFFSGRELWCQKTGAIIIMGIDADFTGGESALTKFRNQSFLIAKLSFFSFPKRKQKYQIKSLFFICI